MFEPTNYDTDYSVSASNVGSLHGWVIPKITKMVLNFSDTVVM